MKLLKSLAKAYYNFRYSISSKRIVTSIKDFPMYQQLRNDVEEYINKLYDGEGYCFSPSNKTKTIYSNTYALLLKRMFGNNIDMAIVNQIMHCQKNDGYFYDDKCLCPKYLSNDGWGMRHFIPHLLPILVECNIQPKFHFKWLDWFADPQKFVNYIELKGFSSIWGLSNLFMNYLACMQYERDYRGNHKYDHTIKYMEQYMINNVIPDIGLWLSKKEKYSISDKYEMIRGAYHILLITEYDKIDFPFKEKVIDIILSLQNKKGGFDFKYNSSACEDIDAIDILIRFSYRNSYRKKEVEKCLVKSLNHLLNNQLQDNGFVFSKHRIFNYGHRSVSSIKNESNLFATWFRFLCIKEIYQFFNLIPTESNAIPGYEIPIDWSKK